MIQEYVVVNAMTSDHHNKLARLLVQKNRPAWQAGYLNLIGGKVEPGEDHEDAAVRELAEETGLIPINIMPVELMGKIVCPDAVIYCYNVWVNEYRPLKPRAGETEKVAWFNWYDLLFDKRLMPNLRVVLPLMQASVHNWTLNVTTNSLGQEHHTVELSLPSSGHTEHVDWLGVTEVLEGKDIINRREHAKPLPTPEPWYRRLWGVG